jgi:ubiquinone biosynthesis protein
MEKMGGLWVKAGQIVALRSDLFSEEFCAELAKLQDRAQGFPLHYARTTIETELGKPLEEIFAEFPDKPLAAASIGQAYQARLRSPDVEVVVKVRRPTIEESFKVDLGYLRRYCWFLTRINFMPNFRWEEMYWELESAILEELDYRQEAASLRRMKKNLRRHKVYVPQVFLEYCTDRVLVMEMVGGVYMSDYIRVAATHPERVKEWLRENDIDAYRAGERLLFSHYRQLFEENLYHCDLHPGNILLMRKNRITLIDFGSIGSTDKTQLMRYLFSYQALAARDYRKFAEIYLLLPPALPNTDLSEVREQIVKLFRSFEQKVRIKSLPYHEKAVAKASGDLAKIIGDAGISAAWEFLRSTRAQLTLDASLAFLMPKIDYLKVLQKYMRQMKERQRKASMSTKLIRAQAARISEQVDLPTKLAENVYFEGERLRKKALKYGGYVSKASNIALFLFQWMARGLGLASLGLIVVCLDQRYHVLRRLDGTWVYGLLNRLPHLGSLIWIALSIGLLYASREFIVIGNILSRAESSRPGGGDR